MSETTEHPSGEVTAPVDNVATDGAGASAATDAQTGVETPTGDGSEGEAKPSGDEAKKKSPVAQLQGRVGHLTKTLHEKDAELAEARRRTEALEAILAAAGKTDGEGDKTPQAHSSTLTKGSPEWQDAVKAEARQLAAAEAFTRQCNDIFVQGVEKHGDTFKEGVANLNALGLMDDNLVQAAMATGAAAAVLNALGQDVDEAQRIAALPPARMGVELAKLAGTLQPAKEPKQVSKTPAPINPVGGAAKREVDIYDPNLSMDEYVARRKAMGSPFAR